MAQLQKGIVKQLLSGDSIVIRGQPKGGPPPERTLGLSGIIAPRLGRRATQSGDETSGTKDEPYAFDSREFLRRILIGREVTFVVEHKVPTSGREYGSVWVRQGEESLNVKESMVNEGLVEVRRTGVKPNESAYES
jgi:staphylococcal nuclease domain-containing protein 1